MATCSGLSDYYYFDKFQPGYSRLIAFLLLFKKSFFVSEKVTDNTTNYYEYKWLFGSLYAVGETGVSTFSFPLIHLG